jgi:intracellular multiplication protein IcmE
VDQNTSRTSLATSVDKHTWLRYGSLFASSFLEGIGQAVSNSGAALSVGTGGAWEVVRNDLSYTDQFIASLGTVGQRFAGAVGSTFATPPTVRVASGAGIGLLFMSDFEYPAEVVGGQLGADYVR